GITMKEPSITISSVYKEDNAGNRVSLTITCEASGFFPEDISISWLKNNSPILKSHYNNSPVTGSDTFSANSILKVESSKQSWENGDLFTCHVTHPAWGTKPSMYNTSKCLACPKSKLRPTIYLAKPSYEDVIKKSGHLTCLVLGYDLAATTITWQVEGKVSSAGKTEPPEKNNNGTTSLVSSHPVSQAQWGQGTRFTCKVSTLCSGELAQEITMVNKDMAKKEPSITISKAYHENLSGTKESLTLICEASGFYPEDISISWLKDNSPELTASYNNVPVAGSSTFSAYSILKVNRNEGTENCTCIVHHPALEEPKRVEEKVSFSGSDCHRPLPKVFLLPPSLEELYVGQNATITCVVSGMESPSSLEISWSKGNGGLLTEDHREPVLHPNGTYSAASVLRVCVEEWQAGEEFTCTVKHQDIPSAEVKTIHKSLEVSLRAPSVYVSPPHAEELALQEWATITCLASGFRPKDILVTWTRKDRPLPQEAYTNISPMREAGEEESYFIYSKLRIQASEWQKGDTYSCMVAHEGLPKIFTQRSVDKASGKPTAVNVSVVLSDTDVTCH
uniref:Ig-like domain-containing protein n=1 Tax=Pelodiscus sinensis TaxID=13735 RepID=K7FHD3_PELSI